jgi:hypothetical protein
MLTFACVLRSGGDYTPAHVAHLRDSVARHLKMPHRFVCLSDVDVPCERIALIHNWSGWWSKIELFRPCIFEGPVMFADLDTIAVGSMDDLALGHRFTVLSNFWSADRIGSGLMAWNMDASSIYHAFLRGPERFMREYRTTEKWGDQGFIFAHAPTAFDRWQRKFPGRIVSWKMHCKNERVPGTASIVCFHGKPRPWTTPLWTSSLKEAV